MSWQDDQTFQVTLSYRDIETLHYFFLRDAMRADRAAHGYAKQDGTPDDYLDKWYTFSALIDRVNAGHEAAHPTLPITDEGRARIAAHVAQFRRMFIQTQLLNALDRKELTPEALFKKAKLKKDEAHDVLSALIDEGRIVVGKGGMLRFVRNDTP